MPILTLLSGDYEVTEEEYTTRMLYGALPINIFDRPNLRETSINQIIPPDQICNDGGLLTGEAEEIEEDDGPITVTCDACNNECALDASHACHYCDRTLCPGCIFTTHNGNTSCDDCCASCEGCDNCFSTTDLTDGYCEDCREPEEIDEERDECERLREEEHNRQYRAQQQVARQASEERTDCNIITPCKDITPEIPLSDYNADRSEFNWNSANRTRTMNHYLAPTNWPKIKADWETKPLYFGMEWELNFATACECDVKCAVETYLSRKYIWKSDGSLSSGAELVLAPMTLQSYRDINLKALCDGLKEAGATGYQNNQAGIHVHISNNAISYDVIQKIMAWFMVNRRFVRRFSKRTIRDINQWARIPYNLECWFEGKSDDMRGDYSRYIAINRTAKTWEFRVFRSTIRYERVKASLNFIHALIYFCHSHSFAACSGNRSFQLFMKYLEVTKEHSFLLNYIMTEPKLLNISKNLGIYLPSDDEPSAESYC